MVASIHCIFIGMGGVMGPLLRDLIVEILPESAVRGSGVVSMASEYLRSTVLRAFCNTEKAGTQT